MNTSFPGRKLQGKINQFSFELVIRIRLKSDERPTTRHRIIELHRLEKTFKIIESLTLSLSLYNQYPLCTFS